MIDSSCAKRRAGIDIGSGDVVYENVHKEFACAVDHPHHAHAGLLHVAVNKHVADAPTGHRCIGVAMTRFVSKLNHLDYETLAHTTTWPYYWQSHTFLEPLQMARALRRLKNEYQCSPTIGSIDFGSERSTKEILYTEHAQGHKPP